jgi:hypothetical protein
MHSSDARSPCAAAVLSLALAACVIDPTGRGDPSGAGGEGAGADASTSGNAGASDASTGAMGTADTTTTSSGSAGAETDCTNALDDDGDGQEDCEDSDCGAFECMPLHPGALAYGALLPSGSPCDAGYAVSSYLDCASDCACALVPGTCELAWNEHATDDCSDDPVGEGTGEACVNSTNAERWFRVTAEIVESPTCERQGSSEYDGTPLDACEVPAFEAGTCGRESVCVPALAADAPRCAIVPGDVPCVAPYQRKATLHLAAGASACSCDCATESPFCAGAALAVSEARDDCGDIAQLVPANGACLPGGYTKSYESNPSLARAQCSPQPATTEATDSVRVCCLPPP